jgi:hypothetical protein
VISISSVLFSCKYFYCVEFIAEYGFSVYFCFSPKTSLVKRLVAVNN